MMISRLSWLSERGFYIKRLCNMKHMPMKNSKHINIGWMNGVTFRSMKNSTLCSTTNQTNRMDRICKTNHEQILRQKKALFHSRMAIIEKMVPHVAVANLGCNKMQSIPSSVENDRHTHTHTHICMKKTPQSSSSFFRTTTKTTERQTSQQFLTCLP